MSEDISIGEVHRAVVDIKKDISKNQLENEKAHDKIQRGVDHTNGTVGDMVAWRIQVNTILWIMGSVVSSIIIPTFVYLLCVYLGKFIK
jgi:hypothetical protein